MAPDRRNPPPRNSPSEWNDWQVFNPDDERRRYAERAAAGSCTRCGAAPPRPGRKTCQALRGSRRGPVAGVPGAAPHGWPLHRMRRAGRRRHALPAVPAGVPRRGEVGSPCLTAAGRRRRPARHGAANAAPGMPKPNRSTRGCVGCAADTRRGRRLRSSAPPCAAPTSRSRRGASAPTVTSRRRQGYARVLPVRADRTGAGRAVGPVQRAA